MSARVRSASEAIGSSEERKRREDSDEARERNEGGGEEGVSSVFEYLRGESGVSSWSLIET